MTAVRDDPRLDLLPLTPVPIANPREMTALMRVGEVVETLIVPRVRQLRQEFLEAAPAGATPAEASDSALAAATVLAYAEHADAVAGSRDLVGLAAWPDGMSPSGEAGDVGFLAGALLAERLAARYLPAAQAALRRARMDELAAGYLRFGLSDEFADDTAARRDELADALAAAICLWGGPESARFVREIDAVYALSCHPGLRRLGDRISELAGQFLDAVTATTPVRGMTRAQADLARRRARAGSYQDAARAAAVVGYGELYSTLKHAGSAGVAGSGISDMLASARAAAVAGTARSAGSHVPAPSFAAARTALRDYSDVIGTMADAVMAGEHAMRLARYLVPVAELPVAAAPVAALKYLASAAIPEADLDAERSRLAGLLRARLGDRVRYDHDLVPAPRSPGRFAARERVRGMNAAFAAGQSGLGELAAARRPGGWRQLSLAASVAAAGVSLCVLAYLGLAGQSLSFTGQVAAARSYALNFTAAGTLDQMYVKRGQRVRAGQVVAKLDSILARSNLRMAQSAVRADTAELAANKRSASAAVVAAERARLAAARTRLILAGQAVRHLSLVAPAAGIVAATAGAAGDLVGASGVLQTEAGVAGDPPVVLLDSGPLEVTAQQSGQVAAGIRIGEPVTLSLSTLGRTMSGKVTNVTADPGRGQKPASYSIVISIEGDQKGLASGLPVTITIR